MKTKLLIFIVMVATLLTGCDKAPDGVIKESDLTDFLYDLYRLEAIIDMNPNQFPTDSTKRVAKQSLFKKHGITQADYDSSLVWYATNFEAYSTVHKKVVMRLQEDKQDLAKEMATAPQQRKTDENSNAQQHKMYASKGDTADIWIDQRSMMLTSGLKRGYFAFDFEPDGEHRKGDRYSLNMKMLTLNNTFGLMLAVEYSDGSVSMSNRNASIDGWAELALQTDSTRNVRRIFGYINYNITNAPTVTFVDSIALLRTHLDRKIYPNINAQKFISRNQNKSTAKPASPTPSKGGPDSVKLYTPKPGVNKSGVVHRTLAPANK